MENKYWSGSSASLAWSLSGALLSAALTGRLSNRKRCISPGRRATFCPATESSQRTPELYSALPRRQADETGLPVPCATRPGRGLRNSAYGLGQSSPFPVPACVARRGRRAQGAHGFGTSRKATAGGVFEGMPSDNSASISFPGIHLVARVLAGVSRPYAKILHCIRADHPAAFSAPLQTQR